MGLVTDTFLSFSHIGQKERRTEIKTVGRGPFCTSRRHISTVAAVRCFPKLFTSLCPYLESVVNFALSRRENYACPFTTLVTSGLTVCINEQGLIFLLPQRCNPTIFFYYTIASILAPVEDWEGGDSAGYCPTYRITWTSLPSSQLSYTFSYPLQFVFRYPAFWLRSSGKLRSV
jgi:hypothetical protein